MQTNYNYLQAEDKVIDQATYVLCGWLPRCKR